MVAEFIVSNVIAPVVKYASVFHLPILIGAFFAGVAARFLVYFTVRRQEWFANEFEKRVNRWLDQQTSETEGLSFSLATKKLLEKTFYEIFETRAKLKRRRGDTVMSTSDRLFLIKQGTAWLVHDVLKQIKFLKWSNQTPKILNVTKNTFQKNPCFNKIFGIIPVGGANDLLNILPGLFVIGGIFGTFLGVMKGLPSLSAMDLNDVDKTKLIMDNFLNDIAHAMSASLMGIFFSVCMTVFNSVFNPERVFGDVIEKFEHSLDLIWNRSDNNIWPSEMADFNEHRDPLEALAQQSIESEIAGSVLSRKLDSNIKDKQAS